MFQVLTVALLSLGVPIVFALWLGISYVSLSLLFILRLRR